MTELLAEERDSPEARALLGQARSRLVYAAGRSATPPAEVARLFAEARLELGDADSPELVWALNSYAVVRNGAGAVEEARRLIAEALEMARRLGVPALIVASETCRSMVYPPTEFPDEYTRITAEIERLCAADPSLGEEVIGWRPWVTVATLGINALFRRGAGGEVDPLLAQMRHRVGESHNAVEQVMLHSISAQVRGRRGDVSGAIEHARQALDWAMQSQNLMLRVVGHGTRGLALLNAGRLDEALEQVEQAMVLAIDRAISNGFAASTGLPALAQIQLGRGDAGAARAAAERGIEVARAMGHRHAEATNLIALARALLASGDGADAETTLTHASELATALDARDLPPRIEEVHAELARLRKDDAAGERALRTAARMHRENGEEWLATQAEARIGA